MRKKTLSVLLVVALSGALALPAAAVELERPISIAEQVLELFTQWVAEQLGGEPKSEEPGDDGGAGDAGIDDSVDPPLQGLGAGIEEEG